MFKYFHLFLPVIFNTVFGFENAYYIMVTGKGKLICENKPAVKAVVELYENHFGVDKLLKKIKVNDKGEILFNFQIPGFFKNNYYLKVFDECGLINNHQCINERIINLPFQISLNNLSVRKKILNIKEINLLENNIYIFNNIVHVQKRCDLHDDYYDEIYLDDKKNDNDISRFEKKISNEINKDINNEKDENLNKKIDLNIYVNNKRLTNKVKDFFLQNMIYKNFLKLSDFRKFFENI
ncbi:Transthyretin-like family-containing protein [Strongyloides ratti]|uniref:Transthyretin-like family-containing protein n=1 Tax=Strongyloides ratti TaxID=34506 RepID=A0A090KUG0_STRRB|nr:Transthyretin-like family-containing protein [Strongyloides ratti]CEF61135.1 Transthyretin-like family-containing protein [Strongyloides ratti]